MTANADLSTRGRATKLHHFPQYHEPLLSVEVLMSKYSHANNYLLTCPPPKSWLGWNGPLRQVSDEKGQDGATGETLSSANALQWEHQGQTALSFSPSSCLTHSKQTHPVMSALKPVTSTQPAAPLSVKHTISNLRFELINSSASYFNGGLLSLTSTYFLQILNLLSFQPLTSATRDFTISKRDQSR